jgi:G:T-mismatch repair DNA endonuclease (very short patch repair protein)
MGVSGMAIGIVSTLFCLKREQNGGRKKIEATQKRDKRIAWLLKKLGWKVSTIYECKLKPGKKDLTLKKLQKDVSISGFL